MFKELYGAAKRGSLEYAKFLVNKGAPLDDVLEEAIVDEDATAVSVLLAVRTPSESEFHYRPLHVACMRQSTKAVELLLQCGADMFERDYFDRVPLSVAIEQQNVEIVDMLLHAAADLNRKPYDEGSPLSDACMKSSVPVIQCLLQHGAENFPDDCGILPIEWACVGGRLDVFKVLVERFGLDQSFPDQQTLLHAASAHSRNKRIVEWVLQQPGVKPNARMVNAKDDRGWTPLHSACNNTKANHVRVLIAAGAEVNAVDDSGFTPLHQFAAEERTGGSSSTYRSSLSA